MYAEVKSAIERVYEAWLKKMADIQKARGPKGANVAADVVNQRMESAVQYFCALLADLVVYLDSRAKLVDLRVLLHKGFLDATPAILKQGLATLSGISAALPGLKHALIVQLAQNMSVEVQLFTKILNIELSIANYQANNAIFSFYALEAELNICKEKFTFVKDKQETSSFLDTALFHWFESIRDSLCEKMQLLFSEFRSLRSSGTVSGNKEPFAQEAGAKLALYEKIVEFTANSGAFNVSLILRPADGMGNGKSSWVPVYTFPQEDAPYKHWPSIISLYQDNMELLDTPTSPPPPLHKTNSSMIVPIPLTTSTSSATSTTSMTSSNSSTSLSGLAVAQPTPQAAATVWPDQTNMAPTSPASAERQSILNIPLNILHYYDTHVDTTYYMATLQPKMLLVIIFKGERLQDDVEVTTFMKGLFAKLRHSQLLQKVLTRATGSSSPANLSRSTTPKVPVTAAATTTS